MAYVVVCFSSGGKGAWKINWSREDNPGEGKLRGVWLGREEASIRL